MRKSDLNLFYELVGVYFIIFVSSENILWHSCLQKKFATFRKDLFSLSLFTETIYQLLLKSDMLPNIDTRRHDSNLINDPI
mmetsp:Transcript_731/g.1142  ORF Transcript_731/g.1142 Transcript_731/m.1142 type:complete len:81 (+) Transcript_731:12-254(+)